MNHKNTFTLFDQESLAPLIEKSEEEWVLVLCTAEWLGSGHILEEFMLAVLREAGSNGVLLYKIDTEVNTEITQQLNIKELPTVTILKNGEFKDYFSGLINKRKIHQKFLSLGVISEEE